MIVVDASALLDVLLRVPDSQAIEDRLLGDGESLHAPHLIDLEIAQVLRRFVRSKEIEERRGRQALEDLNDFPINRYPHDIFLSKIWDLRNNLTAYDAAYIVLAETLVAPLITRDSRLASVSNVNAIVEIV